MSIFKRKRGKSDGKVAAAGVYTVEFGDHNKIIRRVSGFADKYASRELERNLNRLVSFRMANLALDNEASRFLETCPSAIAAKLVEWDVIDVARAASGKAIGESVGVWGRELALKDTEKHVRESTIKVKKIAKAAKWHVVTDINAGDLAIWLEAEIKAGKSLNTLNHYIRAIKTFIAWLVDNEVLTASPLRRIKLFNADTDPRRVRRPLTIKELGRLLAAAECGRVVHGMTGYERALLYQMAIETGLRWSELWRLTWANFDFTTDPATVTIEAKSAKNRKKSTLPLRPSLAAKMRDYLANHEPGERVFSTMWKDKGFAMLKVDLAAAGIAYKDKNGEVADFHSHRHTMESLLCNSGVPLVTAQKLMRHSDPKLTANIYTHAAVEDKAEALAKLPEIEPFAYTLSIA